MIATNITADACSMRHEIDGVIKRCAYENSEYGRARFMAECADCENYAEVMAAWGDEPTVFPEEWPENTTPPTPTTQDQIDANAAAIEELAMLLTEVI